MAHLLFFLLFLIHVSIFADEWGDITDLQLSQTKPTNLSLSNYWDEHCYGSLSGMVSYGENHSRYASEFKLGFSEHWRDLKVVLEAAHRQNLVRTKYELQTNDDAVIETGEMDLKHTSLEMRQMYIDYYPIESMTLSFGRQTTVWGQLDIFSPVDFFLPIDFNPMGFSLVKADNRMPQTTARLSYFPTSNLEFALYYFPIYEESQLFKTIDLSSDYVEFDGDRYFTKKVLPSGSSQASAAARLIWYSSFITGAITYYDGFNNVFPIYRSKYIGEREPEGSKSYVFQEIYGYFPKRGLGVEANIPFGKMNIKAEATITDDFYGLDYSTKTNEGIVNAIRNFNDGYDTIPIYQSFCALGIDADFDRWFYNFYLMKIAYFKNPSMNKFWSVYEPVYGKPKFEDIPLFPTLNIGRYLSEEKKGAFGLAFGYFTGSLGAFVYLSNQINESLSWGLSADYGFNFSDFALISNNSEEGDSSGGESVNYLFFEPKLTFGLGYKI